MQKLLKRQKILYFPHISIRAIKAFILCDFPPPPNKKMKLEIEIYFRKEKKIKKRLWSPSKISEPYNNPFWDCSNGGKKKN